MPNSINIWLAGTAALCQMISLGGIRYGRSKDRGEDGQHLVPLTEPASRPQRSDAVSVGTATDSLDRDNSLFVSMYHR